MLSADGNVCNTPKQTFPSLQHLRKLHVPIVGFLCSLNSNDIFWGGFRVFWASAALKCCSKCEFCLFVYGNCLRVCLHNTVCRSTAGLLLFLFFLWCEEQVRDKPSLRSNIKRIELAHQKRRGGKHFNKYFSGIAAAPNVHSSKVHNPAIVSNSAFTKDACLEQVKNQRNMQQIIGNISTQSTVYTRECFRALCLRRLWEYLTASRADENFCSTQFMCPAFS